MHPGWRRAYARSSLVQRRDLGVERVDHRERDLHLLAGARFQRLRGEPREPVTVHQVPALRAAVVIEHRLDPLLPFAALLRQGVAQPDAGAEIEDVIGRDPRLREPAGHQQLPQMPGVRTVALRALLAPPQGRGLRRLGQVHPRADRVKLLDDEPPARRGLQRHLELLASEAANELVNTSPVSGRHPRARDLAGGRIDPVGGDLRSMLVKSH